MSSVPARPNIAPRRPGRVATAWLAVALLTAGAAARAVQPGDEAPSWALTDGAGDEVVFPADAEGAPSVLFFWATWCPYCHAVMPYLQQILDDYRDAGVNVYAIDFKDQGDPVGHMKELGYRFIVLPLGDLVADDYDVWSAPGLFVVDGEGTVLYRRGHTRAPPGKEIAEVWDSEIRAALEAALDR
jgi:thiol-disulfide isomerase/thioredoxin